MQIPFFEHTIKSLHSLISDERASLSSVAGMIRHDPGLYLNLIQGLCLASGKCEAKTALQAISLLGAQGVERQIIQHDILLNEEHMQLWCYSVLAGELAVLINNKAGIEDEEVVYFSASLPIIGMLIMLIEKLPYKKVYELLLMLPIEDRVFVEQKLFQTSHIELLTKNFSAAAVYMDLINFINAVISAEGSKRPVIEEPGKLSLAYETFQLFYLMDTAGAGARAVLFPSVVEAQEKFRELCKRYFLIAESEVEELLAEALERLNAVSKLYNVEEAAMYCTASAEEIKQTAMQFLTKSPELNAGLERIRAAVCEEKNVLICGERGTGKRLLAAALYYQGDNPRRLNPYVTFHCDTSEDLLERDLFGSRSGYHNLQKHKGALEFANGGTILLKDIDRMPEHLLDRIIEIYSSGKFFKSGDKAPQKLDIRFILTSKYDLTEIASEGSSLRRLLDCLSPEAIRIPPLRERRQDIEFIADSIISKYRLNLNEEALRLGLQEYYEKEAFPGNLKDLKKLLFYIAAKHRLKS
ncbi:MAG: HDOD domain-containing protein [Nitrospirae bacterium]|nr:MAG: HDOD domain-containing protein [Nitrospirota bacterium]